MKHAQKEKNIEFYISGSVYIFVQDIFLSLLSLKCKKRLNKDNTKKIK